MAIAFYVPDEEDLSHTASGTTTTGTSSVQSPPASPINPNEFIQAFYDALYRYSQTGVAEMPHSPSCPTCGSPGPFVPATSSPGSPQNESLDRSRRQKRKRLSSIGEEQSDEESASDSGSESSDSSTDAFEHSHVLDTHLRHMEAREQLELFSGHLPPPRATTAASSSSAGAKVPTTSTNAPPQTRSKTKAGSN